MLLHAACYIPPGFPLFYERPRTCHCGASFMAYCPNQTRCAPCAAKRKAQVVVRNARKQKQRRKAAKSGETAKCVTKGK